jgi:tetratricopeptide (TPR) repeat protein
MRGAVVGIAIVLAAVAANGAVAADSRWTRVEAEHFVVSGDVPSDDVRQVAYRLETFREVFARVIPGARERSLIPTFVLVFGSDAAFTPYKPRYDGKPAQVGGYTVREPLAPCMALRLDRSRDSYRTVFHEYAHVLFDPSAVPLWLSEGIADYYSTATVLRDRLHVELGRVIPGHLASVSRVWVPLPQIMAVTNSSRTWGTDAGRVFYAESWALVHYLMRATPARGAQITRFIARLARGDDEASAFEREIGPPKRIDAEVQRYVSSGMMAPEVVSLPAQIGVKPLSPRPMSAAEVEASRARLLYQLGRDDEARQRVDSALRLKPDLAEAHVTRGLLLLREDHPEEAVAPLRRALARDPDNLLAAYNFSLATLWLGEAGFEEAYAALVRVVRPDDPAEPLAVLGILAGRLGRLGEAERLLRRAVELAPAWFPAQVELADVCLRTGKFDESRRIMARLASRATGSQSEAVDQRRGWLAMAEARASVRTELAALAGLAEPGPDPALDRTGTFPAPRAFRAPLPGDQRALGIVERVDCVDDGIAASVVTKAGRLELTAAGMSEVHLASARQDVNGSLPCGPHPRREAVYVTWRGDHELVALEFLPEDLNPMARR